MSRISEAFSHGKALITFLPAGDPNMSRTREYLTELSRAGADIIGVVLPMFECVGKGTEKEEQDRIRSELEEIFAVCRSFREKEKTPLVFMTRAVLVYCFGKEEFFGACHRNGIDGVILSGILREQEEELSREAKANQVDWIRALPVADAQENQRTEEAACGFLYLNSGKNAEGKKEDPPVICQKVQDLRRAAKLPVVIGFGIHTTDQATEAARMSDGIAVGSVFANMIAQYGGHAAPHIYTYARMMREAVRFSER